MTMNTVNKVMVVTGGGRGIGAAIAKLAARSGYAVGVNYVKNSTAADAVVGEIEKGGGRALALRADVGDQRQVMEMFNKVDEKLGTIDVLVNNAGVLGTCRVEDIDDATVSEMFRANVFSMYFCSREAVRRMSTRLGGHGGSIVNMSSVASRLGGLAGGTAYAATKGAIDTFSLALAKEVGAEGIRVNTLRPGLIETEIHELHGGVNPDLGKLVPMGRWGGADEVARAALWVASDEASYVHAAIIDVSGGR